MWRTSASERGVSLVEFLVYMALVVVLLVFSAQVLFSMRRSATRMELATAARQTARQAVEYIARYVRGATDMNPEGDSPASILVWYRKGAALKQATWNNVTATYADAGTDVITLAYAVSELAIPSSDPPSWLASGIPSSVWFDFDLGCPDDAANLALFEQITGKDPTTGRSPWLLVSGENGGWAFFQITGYQQSDCTTGRVHVVANPGASGQLNPPAALDIQNAVLHPGVRFVSFRVRDGWLEQKDGVFDPDNPDDGFQQVLPDVEDLQVAWIYADGTVWNGTPASRLGSTGGGVYVNDVPTQGTTNQYDVTNVRGLRITVTARSPEEVGWEPPPGRFFRPAAEDHPADPNTRDRFYHRRMTQVVMLRNRSLGR